MLVTVRQEYNHLPLLQDRQAACLLVIDKAIWSALQIYHQGCGKENLLAIFGDRVVAAEKGQVGRLTAGLSRRMWLSTPRPMVHPC